MREIDTWSVQGEMLKALGENDIKIYKGVYGGYICYIGFFVQRSILEGIWILYVVFFVLGNIYGGNTARPPSRPDPRTGVRFLC